MIFSNCPFLIFFCLYFPLHLLTPNRYRIVLILLGSAFFYGYYKPSYVGIPVLLTIIAFAGVLSIESKTAVQDRRLRLTLTIILLLLPLMFYKYTDFFATSLLGPFFGSNEKIVNLPLPLGISFFTFTLISYVVDVYKGRFPVERKFHMLLAYVLYFPHQIAGPILKPIKLIPQLENPKKVEHARFLFGATLFALGLIKKVLFAASISPLVDTVYQSAGSALGRGDYWLAFYGFPMQIYCDFSGYTDMALGLAFLLGVRLPANFASPYRADSLIDFWRRWHITFSFWLRDYLYIPLGGNRNGFGLQIRNIFITMILGGLWHGAHWTFVLWGALHGSGIAFCHVWRHYKIGRLFPPIPKWLGVLLTFHVVCFSWVFFRAPDFASAVMIFKGLAAKTMDPLSAFAVHNSFLLFLLAFFYITHGCDDMRRFFVWTRRVPKPMVWAAISAMIVLSLALSGGNSAPFIYFDF